MAVILMSALNCKSQERMSFKGVEMNTDLVTFVNKLVEQGIKIKEHKLGDISYTYTLSGAFAGYSNCEIFVFGKKDKTLVYKVVVYLPEDNSWYSIKSDYNKLKEAYIKKYGAPSEDFHFFSSPYYEGDGYELTAIKIEKCYYSTFWTFDYGTIYTEISKYCQIKIVYEDKVNMESLSQLKEDAVNSDI